MRLICSVCFTLLSFCCHAQYQLQFSNTEMEDTYTVEAGDYLKLRYFGYEGQEAEVESYVHEVTPAYVLFTQPLGKGKYNDDQVIMLEDITGFNKMSKVRPFLSPMVSLGVGVGIYYAIGTNDALNNNEQFLYSLGASLGTRFLINWVFKSKIKLKISDGWTVNVVAAPDNIR